MLDIIPCLWFDGNAEEAARFYASVFPDSRVDAVNLAPADYPNGKRGDVLTVEFTLSGRRFVGLNGGPNFKFNEAVSFQVHTRDQAETDRMWDALLADGGKPSVCGWLQDRFGLFWQVSPKALLEAVSGPDKAGAARAMQAMMGMVKIDIAVVEAAYAGRG